MALRTIENNRLVDWEKLDVLPSADLTWKALKRIAVNAWETAFEYVEPWSDLDLGGLNDVTITTPITGEVVRYNAGLWQWENWIVPWLWNVTAGSSMANDNITVWDWWIVGIKDWWYSIAGVLDTDNHTDWTTNWVYTLAERSKLAWIEALADVTDTTNVTAAGALMDSELASIADVKALNQSVINWASPVFVTTNMTEWTDKNFVTDAEAIVIWNTSWINTW